jgi:hypothetical protein
MYEAFGAELSTLLMKTCAIRSGKSPNVVPRPWWRVWNEAGASSIGDREGGYSRG